MPHIFVCLRFVRNLIKVKMFAISIIPIALIAFGIISIHYFRHNNYGCGTNVPDQSTTMRSRATQSIVSVLVVTYALEVLVFPLMMVNSLIRYLKNHHFFDRDRGRAFRFEFKFGLFLKLLQHLTRGKAGGEQSSRCCFSNNLLHIWLVWLSFLLIMLCN